MNNRLKRIAAIIGVIVILAAFSCPMFFAMAKGENYREMFIAAMGVAIFVPVMAYAIWMVYKLTDRRKPKKEQNIENIIFDVGRVLMDFDWETYLKGFHFDKEEERTLAEVLFKSQEWNERDRGLYDESHYVDNFVAKAPQYEKDIREVMRRTDKTLALKDYAESWVKYLKNQGYHLYILSNYSRYLLDLTQEQMKFLPYMDGILFSCEVGQIKPEPEIYQTLLKRFSLNPDKSVFIDDREDNCQAAREQGIHTIVFKEFRQAAQELKKLGVE